MEKNIKAASKIDFEYLSHSPKPILSDTYLWTMLKKSNIRIVQQYCKIAAKLISVEIVHIFNILNQSN